MNKNTIVSLADANYFDLLMDTLLLRYVSNSFILLSGVLFLTFVFGVIAAYFVSFYYRSVNADDVALQILRRKPGLELLK